MSRRPPSRHAKRQRLKAAGVAPELAGGRLPPNAAVLAIVSTLARRQAYLDSARAAAEIERRGALQAAAKAAMAATSGPEAAGA